MLYKVRFRQLSRYPGRCSVSGLVATEWADAAGLWADNRQGRKEEENICLIDAVTGALSAQGDDFRCD